MMHDGSTITPTTLVALPQPQQGNDLLSGKVALGQGVDVRGTCLFVCCDFTIFFMSDVWVHLSILSPCAAMMSSSKRAPYQRSEEHTSELQSHSDLVCRLLLEKK